MVEVVRFRASVGVGETEESVVEVGLRNREPSFENENVVLLDA